MTFAQTAAGKAGTDHDSIEQRENAGRWLALAVVCVGTMLAFVNA